MLQQPKLELESSYVEGPSTETQADTAEEKLKQARNDEIRANFDSIGTEANTAPDPISLHTLASTPEYVIEVSLEPPVHPTDSNSSVGYSLPPRQNGGKPPIQYSPDINGKGLKYFIVNFTSIDALLEPFKAFVYQFSSSHVPRDMEEAL